MKIRVLQFYYVLWIHDIDEICTFNVTSMCNFLAGYARMWTVHSIVNVNLVLIVNAIANHVTI